MACRSGCRSSDAVMTTSACCRWRARTSRFGRRRGPGRCHEGDAGAALECRMALKDARGNLLGTDSAAALDAAETALWRMMSFYDPPLPDLDRAIELDPHWPLPH